MIGRVVRRHANCLAVSMARSKVRKRKTTTTERCLSVTALQHIRIPDPLHLGEPVGHGLKVTNDEHRIDGFFTEHFQRMVGILEARALLGANAIVFEFSRVATSDRKADRLIGQLNNFLVRARLLLVGFWMLKDNAVDFELGFSETPHAQNPSQVTSNYLAAGTRFADGTVQETVFAKAELQRVAAFLNKMSPVVTLENGAQPRALGRLGRALYLIQAARAQEDIGLKVGFYCAALEALFATAAAELSHKLAERVAYFTAPDAVKRVEVFESVKAAYGVRSAVMHGDTVSRKDRPKLVNHARFCDSILRDSLNTLFSSKDLITVFESQEKLDDYLKRLTLGVLPTPSNAA